MSIIHDYRTRLQTSRVLFAEIIERIHIAPDLPFSRYPHKCSEQSNTPVSYAHLQYWDSSRYVENLIFLPIGQNKQESLCIQVMQGSP